MTDTTPNFTAEQIDYMANKFLGWHLPKNFNPDGGISFEPVAGKGTPYEYNRIPQGTNFLSFEQAREMVRHIVEGLPTLSVQAEAREPEKIMQSVTGEKGNCFSACLAAMLGIRLSDVPNFFDLGTNDREWWIAVRTWLADFNIGVINIGMWGDYLKNQKGFLIVGGMGKRGHHHAVIFKDGELWHDPHPDKDGIEAPDSVDLLYPLNPLRPFGRAGQKPAAVDLDAMESLKDFHQSRADVLEKRLEALNLKMVREEMCNALIAFGDSFKHMDAGSILAEQINAAENHISKAIAHIDSVAGGGNG